MKKGKRILGISIAVIVFAMSFNACSNASREKMISELMETDLAFSEMTSDKGVQRALENYVDTNEIVLNSDQIIIDGKSAIIDHFRNCSDSGYVISWKPLGATIASSGDLGYTYGVYLVASFDSVAKGTYVTVWKKTKKGNWKFVLDSDQEGI